MQSRSVVSGCLVRKMDLKMLLTVIGTFVFQILLANSEFTQSTMKPGLPSQEFLEAFNEMDDFGNYITFTALEIPLRQKSPVIETCYKNQKDTYEKIVKKFSSLTKNAANEIQKKFKTQYPDFGDRCAIYLNKVAAAMIKYPEKLWEKIISHKYEKAAELLDDTRAEVDEQIVYFVAEMKKLKKLSKEANKKAESAHSLFTKIRFRIKKECQVLAGNIRRCMKKNENSNFASDTNFLFS